MAAMLAKFLLLICVASTFGHMVREHFVPGNPGIQAQDSDAINQVLNQHDLDPDDLRQQWQNLVTFVNRKIEGLEMVIAEKDERINQLEVNLASQNSLIREFTQEASVMKAEIRELKQKTSEVKPEIRELKQEALDKDEVIDMLVTKVADLEKVVIPNTERYGRTLPPFVTSQFPRTENNQNRLHFGNTSESSSGFRPEDMSIPQADDADTVIDTHKGPGDSPIVKFQRFRPKRVIPKSTTAFHVAFSANTAVTADDIVVYDVETLDQGEGYNPDDGLYTVPESGTYVITWTTLCSSHNLFQTILVVNGAVRGSSWTDSDDARQSTAIVVLTLNQGDHVFIRMGHTFGHGTILTRSDIGKSTFSGWKLD